MEFKQIIVLLIAGLISCTGIFVNIFKNKNNNKVVRAFDNNSLMLFRIFIPFALVSSLIIFFFFPSNANISYLCEIVSYILILLGYCIRLIAIITLGDFFTVEISILEHHELKTNGIYKKIRHPSYTGLLIYYLGMGLLMNNYFCLAILTIIPVLVVLYRIYHEEKILQQHFLSNYKDYMKNSYKLFPYIY